MILRKILPLLFFLISPAALAQGYIGNLAVDSLSASQSLTASKKFIITPMTQTQRDALPSPTQGTMIFNSDTNAYNYWDGDSWEGIGGGLAPLTANRALVSDGSGLVSASAVTSTTLTYLDIGSSLTTLLAAKAPLASPTFSGTIGTALTASRAVQTDGSGNLSASSVTTTQMGYVANATSNLCGINQACTETNKTFTAAVVNSPTGIVKGDVGLGNVDNTSDATKNSAAVTLTNKAITSPTITLPAMTNGEIWTEVPPLVSTPSAGTKHVFADSTYHDLSLKNDSGFVERLRSEVVFENKLENPGFEKGTTGWTASGGTFTTDTSSTGYMGIGYASGTWDSSSAGQTLTSPSYTIGNGYAGTNGLFRCKVRTPSGAATHTMGLWDGSTLTDTITIPSSTTAQYVEIAKPFGAAGTTIALRFTSAASNEPLISPDDCYIGRNFNIGDVKQAQKLGSIRWAGTASCIWNTTSTSFGNFAADADCPAPTVTGSVTAPGTKIPALVLPSIPAGSIYLVASGAFYKSGSGTQVVNFRISDGTLSTSPVEIWAGATENITPHVIGSIDYSTSQGSTTFNIQARAGGASTTANVAAGAAGSEELQIDVYYYPTQNQTIARMENYNWRVDANISGANFDLGSADQSAYIGMTNGSMTLTNNSGKATLTAMIPCSSTNAPSGTTCSAGTEDNGVVFDIPAATDVRACVSFSHNAATGATGIVATTFEIVETPTNAQTISQEGKSRVQSSNANASTTVNFPHQVCGTFTFTTAGQKALRLFYEQDNTATVNGNLVIGDAAAAVGQRDIHWEVYPVSNTAIVPLMVGGVTSNSTGLERVERARISGGAATSVCSSTPCTVASQSGTWITGCTRASAGNYTCTVAAGIFSGIPSCTIMAGGAATYTSGLPTGALSATSLPIGTGSGSTATDTYFDIICMGPR